MVLDVLQAVFRDQGGGQAWECCVSFALDAIQMRLLEGGQRVPHDVRMARLRFSRVVAAIGCGVRSMAEPSVCVKEWSSPSLVNVRGYMIFSLSQTDAWRE